MNAGLLSSSFLLLAAKPMANEVVRRIEEQRSVGCSLRGWLIAGFVMAGVLVCFPPQRRSGNWVDMNRKAQPAWKTYRHDRFMFGYLPHFNSVLQLGSQKRELVAGPTTVGIEGVGTYQYTDTHWVVDWQWVRVITIVFLLVAVAHLLFAFTQIGTSISR